MTKQDYRRLHTAVLDWYRRCRRDLPWRRSRDPYEIAVSEVMLQQTQVDRVLPKYLAFLDRFPDLQSLATAGTADVLRAWAGLGYNTRAVRLQKLARSVVDAGAFPTTEDELRNLPGVGPYTAGAIASFAFDRPVAVVDTNVRRVLGRSVAGSAEISERRAWELANAALPQGSCRDWNQALMDLGATICVARKPRCLVCPIRSLCKAFDGGNGAIAERKAVYRSSPFKTTRRYFRGRILAVLRDAPAGGMTISALGEMLPDRPERHGYELRLLLETMTSDGLLTVAGETVRLG